MILAKVIANEKWIRQVDISRATGIAESTISSIMNGRFYPYPSQAEKIAIAIGYKGDLDELFRETGVERKSDLHHCPLCGSTLGGEAS